MKCVPSHECSIKTHQCWSYSGLPLRWDVHVTVSCSQPPHWYGILIQRSLPGGG